jgi:fumarate hydratase subunit beta
MFELLDRGQPLPFDICGAVIYYAGPTPTRPGMAVGSCGHTTSSRMDRFTPRLLDMGLAAMIGKGARSPEVVEAMIRNGAAYFCATGGAGALIAKCVKTAKEIAFPELGCESVKVMTVEDLPLFTAIDSFGGNLFVSGRKQYER